MLWSWLETPSVSNNAELGDRIYLDDEQGSERRASGPPYEDPSRHFKVDSIRKLNLQEIAFKQELIEALEQKKLSQ